MLVHIVGLVGLGFETHCRHGPGGGFSDFPNGYLPLRGVNTRIWPTPSNKPSPAWNEDVNPLYFFIVSPGSKSTCNACLLQAGSVLRLSCLQQDGDGGALLALPSQPFDISPMQIHCGSSKSVPSFGRLLKRYQSSRSIRMPRDLALRPAAQIQGFLRWTDKCQHAFAQSTSLLPLTLETSTVGFVLPGWDLSNFPLHSISSFFPADSPRCCVGLLRG